MKQNFCSKGQLEEKEKMDETKENKNTSQILLEEIAEESVDKNDITSAQFEKLKETIDLIFSEEYSEVPETVKVAVVCLEIFSNKLENVLENLLVGIYNRDKTAKKFNILYSQVKKIYDSAEKKWPPLDVIYLSIICVFSVILSEVDDRDKIINEISDQAQLIYKDNPRNQSIALNYLVILFNLSKFQIYKKHESELEKTFSKADILIKELSENKEYSMSNKEKFIDNIILTPRKIVLPEEKINIEEIKKNRDNDAEVISRWLILFSKNKLTFHDKIGIFKRPLELLKSYTYLIKEYSTIYLCVQDIKYQLAVKDFTNLKFGHYTRSEVLQKFLNQEDKSSVNYGITVKSRLNNVGYMNDPEEGKILDKSVGLTSINYSGDIVSSSSWFLMSLTEAIDELPMWSQYGENAEGVCLELRPDSFSELTSINDIEWFKQKVETLSDIEKAERNDEEVPSSPNTKDYLYRICYLDEKKLKKGEINISRNHNSKLNKENGAIDKVELSLEQIKKNIASFNNEKQINVKQKEKLFYELDNLLEEIRYLFKSSGYSHEKELRLLKYEELKPTNKKIKIQKMSPTATVYIERDTSIQIKKIIFGPKYNNPENVTPLVHLLDNKIVCSRSSQKYK